MRKTECIMSLECVLTNEEKIACSKVQNESINQKYQAELDLKSFSVQKKSEIAEADAMIALQYQKLSTGKEYRPVKCHIWYNFESNEKTYMRLDTSEIVKVETISAEELQEEADLKGN
jgi:hypothetical protein